MAALEFFLRLDGIPGESTVRGHEKEIVLSDFSWGEQSSVAGGGSGLVTGRFTPRDFSIAKAVDVSSVALMKAGASGRRLRSAVLTVRRSDRQLDYFKMEFSNVIVTSYNVGASGGAPVDTATFGFEQVTFIYREVRPDGGPGAETKDSFNFRAMRPSRSTSKAKAKTQGKTKAKTKAKAKS